MPLRPYATPPVLLCVLALAGCGSQPVTELPPAATLPEAPPQDARPAGRVVTGHVPATDPHRAPAAGGAQVAVLSVRERVLDLYDVRTRRRLGRANAGSGPVQVASDGGNYVYVTDSIGGSVLVFHTVPELTLVRRYGLAGNPWAIVHDERRRRLWVTLAGANRVAELTTGRRIRRLADYAALRQPSAVAVGDEGISVTGSEQGVVQLLRPRTR